MLCTKGMKDLEYKATGQQTTSQSKAQILSRSDRVLVLETITQARRGPNHNSQIYSLLSLISDRFLSFSGNNSTCDDLQASGMASSILNPGLAEWNSNPVL